MDNGRVLIRLSMKRAFLWILASSSMEMDLFMEKLGVFRSLSIE